MNTLLLIAIFTLAYWLGFMIGKGSGLYEASQTLERLEEQLKNK